MPLTSHLITCLAPDGAYHAETMAGRTLAQVIEDVRGGHVSYPLVSVHALDFTTSKITDVTEHVLVQAVGFWEKRDEDVPGCLWDACEVYGVTRFEPVEYVGDENAEHRLTGADYGIVTGRRAA